MSDDPNVNGTADPIVAGDEDPTRVTIGPAPTSESQKISTDLTATRTSCSPARRCATRSRSRTSAPATPTDALLRDAVPANTTYVAGSTTLNGTPVAGCGRRTSPLVARHAAVTRRRIRRPGRCPPTRRQRPTNVATITFDVRRRPDRGRRHGDLEPGLRQRGHRPASSISRPTIRARRSLNDPTRDIVGNLPLLYAEKTAALQVDNGSPGIVDPGDVLRYTITVHNTGAIPATRRVLTDVVPANTTYVADTMTLNGLPVGQPDGGVFPLAAGIWISSSDLTPPLPGPGDGTLSPGTRGDHSVRPARQRRHAARHADQQPGGGHHREAARPADRRRRQPGDRAGADGRRGRRRAAALDHEAGLGGRRRRRARRARRSNTS